MSATAVQNRTLPKLQTNTYDGNEDRYTVASTASTNITLQSQYSVNTDNYIPVSRLSRHAFRLRTTSSFPNILNLYQQPISEEGVDEDGKRKQKVTRRKERKTAKGGIDWETLIEKRSKHENRAIRIEAIARDQMEKYEVYIKSLHDKVTKQREDRKVKDDEYAERIHKEELDRFRYTPKKRRKHKYVSDKRFLKKLPMSKMNKMVRLSDNLQKKGVLKTQGEVDKFWKDFGHSGLETDIFKSTPMTEDASQWVSEGTPTIRKTKSKKDGHRKTSVAHGQENSNHLDNTTNEIKKPQKHKKLPDIEKNVDIKNKSKSLPEKYRTDQLIDERMKAANEI